MRITYEVGFYADTGNGHEPSHDWRTIRECKTEGAVTRFIKRALRQPDRAGLTARPCELGECGLMVRVALEEPEPEPFYYEGGYSLVDVLLLHFTDWLDKVFRKEELAGLGAFCD